MKAYEGKCALTGCPTTDVLEAAHICPYLGPHTNHVTNGLLLRADIHTLFDLGLILISPIDRRIKVDEQITDKEYRQHHKKHLREPASVECRPSDEALRSRYKQEQG